MYAYHIPPQRRPKNDDGYFEVLSQSVFQAGFSWEVVRRKWPNFRKAFSNFKIATVVRMGPRDVSRLLRDSSIIRNGEKLAAVMQNARIVQRLQREHGSFANFIQSISKLPYAKSPHHPERSEVKRARSRTSAKSASPVNKRISSGGTGSSPTSALPSVAEVAGRRAVLGKTFRWIGPTGAYHFFWCVGEPVPEWEDRNR